MSENIKKQYQIKPIPSGTFGLDVRVLDSDVNRRQSRQRDGILDIADVRQTIHVQSRQVGEL